MRIALVLCLVLAMVITGSSSTSYGDNWSIITPGVQEVFLPNAEIGMGGGAVTPHNQSGLYVVKLQLSVDEDSWAVGFSRFNEIEPGAINWFESATPVGEWGEGQWRVALLVDGLQEPIYRYYTVEANAP